MTQHERHMAAVRAVQRRTRFEHLLRHGRVWALLRPQDRDAVNDELQRVAEEMRANGQEP